MKKLLLIPLLLLVSACSAPIIETCTVGVVFKKPMIFGSGGVDSDVLKPGRVLTALTTEVINVNTCPVRHDEVFDDLVPQDKTPTDVQVYLVTQVVEKDASSIVSDFQGENWYRMNLQKPFRDIVRESMREYTSDQIVSDEAVLKKLKVDISEQLLTIIESKELPITLVDLGFDQAQPPESVRIEIARTATEKQRIKTEKQRELAELAREASQKAKATADVAYRKEFNMTNAEYLELRKIEVDLQMVDLAKDNPDVKLIMMTGGASNNATPTYDVNKL